jgi:hypothetical protein
MVLQFLAATRINIFKNVFFYGAIKKKLDSLFEKKANPAATVRRKVPGKRVYTHCGYFSQRKSGNTQRMRIGKDARGQKDSTKDRSTGLKLRPAWGTISVC